MPKIPLGRAIIGGLFVLLANPVVQSIGAFFGTRAAAKINAAAAKEVERIKAERIMTQEWVAPSEFDLVKELNAHAGRLSTMLSLILAALAITVSNTPLRDVIVTVATSPLVPGFSWARLAVFPVIGLSILVVGYVLVAALALIGAMQPAVAVDNSRASWQQMVQTKTRNCEVSVYFLMGTIIGLVGLWGVFASQGAPNSGTAEAIETNQATAAVFGILMFILMLVVGFVIRPRTSRGRLGL